MMSAPISKQKRDVGLSTSNLPRRLRYQVVVYTSYTLTLLSSMCARDQLENVVQFVAMDISERKSMHTQKMLREEEEVEGGKEQVFSQIIF